MTLLNFAIAALLGLYFQNCAPAEKEPVIQKTLADEKLKILTGAEQVDSYLPLLRGKKIVLVVNHTARIGETHLVDSLLKRGISISKIFAPEHGFRGDAAAGEKIEDGKDPKTGIPLISLYGKKKKPAREDLQDADLVVFDIQDVGVRFYTYISTLHFVMEACAENKKPLLILDRPNPNGHYVDGPVLKKDFQSFVGMHEVPVVHGMTVAEYARMINGEGWLKGGPSCQLDWVSCKNYDHQSAYQLPVPPSPNLPNMRAVYLYPSLCFFEGTVVSEGRGTDAPFQQFGHPGLGLYSFAFMPVSKAGARRPKLENQTCFGKTFTDLDAAEIFKWRTLKLEYLLETHRFLSESGSLFFLENNFFDKLAGSENLRRQIEKNMPEAAIRESWQDDLNAFKKIRKKYLLYDDFE